MPRWEAGPPAFLAAEIYGVYMFERVMLYQNSEKWLKCYYSITTMIPCGRQVIGKS